MGYSEAAEKTSALSMGPDDSAGSAESVRGAQTELTEKSGWMQRVAQFGRVQDGAPEPANKTWLQKLASFGRVEVNGVTPIPLEERTVTKTVNIFTLWACMNANMLPISSGMLGPSYGLSIRDSSLVILFFTLLTAVLPAYCSTLGPKTGMRQMILARFSFGRYLVAVPVLLNLATLTGFCVIMVAIGGQCLSAAGNGNLSPDVGIVIVAILALVISFCGFRVLHVYEKYAWAPALISIIIAVGCGGSDLKKQSAAEPSTAYGVLSFGMIVASYMIPWACLASDFTTYLQPQTSSHLIFWYSYAGCVIPTVLLMVLGAAMQGAVANVPSWTEGYDQNNVGGVMAAMMGSTHRFGKFVTVVLAFSLLGNIAATSYSITLNFQILIPILKKVPRYFFAILLTAIVIPVGIVAASSFFDSLQNFISIIGYWAAAFVAIMLTEHVVFRRCDCSRYDIDAWDTASLLPPGIAALSAGVCSFGLVIPAMSQIWYTGPIAETTGDLGFEFAFVLSSLLYVPFRLIEQRVSGR